MKPTAMAIACVPEYRSVCFGGSHCTREELPSGKSCRAEACVTEPHGLVVDFVRPLSPSRGGGQENSTVPVSVATDCWKQERRMMSVRSNCMARAGQSSGVTETQLKSVSRLENGHAVNAAD